MEAHTRSLALGEERSRSERDEVRRAGSRALGSLGENVSGQRGPKCGEREVGGAAAQGMSGL